MHDNPGSPNVIAPDPSYRNMHPSKLLYYLEFTTPLQADTHKSNMTKVLEAHMATATIAIPDRV